MKTKSRDKIMNIYKTYRLDTIITGALSMFMLNARLPCPVISETRRKIVSTGEDNFIYSYSVNTLSL